MEYPYPPIPLSRKYGAKNTTLFCSYFEMANPLDAVNQFEAKFVEMPEALSNLDLLEMEVWEGRLPYCSLQLAFDFRILRDEFEQAEKYIWIMKYWDQKGLNDIDFYL